MDLTELKITTFGYVASKPSLTKQEKLVLLNFVKEGSERQLEYLIKKGRMYTEKEIDSLAKKSSK